MIVGGLKADNQFGPSGRRDVCFCTQRPGNVRPARNYGRRPKQALSIRQKYVHYATYFVGTLDLRGASRQPF